MATKGESTKYGQLLFTCLLVWCLVGGNLPTGTAGGARLWHSLAPSKTTENHPEKASSPTPGIQPYHPPVFVLLEYFKLLGTHIGLPPSVAKHLTKSPVNPPSGPSTGDKPGIPPYPVLPSPHPPNIPLKHMTKAPGLPPSGPSSGNEPGMPPLPGSTPTPLIS